MLAFVTDIIQASRNADVAPRPFVLSQSQQDVLTALAERRRAFERCLSQDSVQNMLQAAYEDGSGYGVLSTCPACGYPAIRRRSFYEICSICDWEDDGQDDPEFAPYPDYFLADDVAGGPNGNYSLTEARLNFADHHDVYRPGDLSRSARMAEDRHLREALIAIFDSLLPEVRESDFTQAYPRINRAFHLISEAVSRTSLAR